MAPSGLRCHFLHPGFIGVTGELEAERTPRLTALTRLILEYVQHNPVKPSPDRLGESAAGHDEPRVRGALSP